MKNQLAGKLCFDYQRSHRLLLAQSSTKSISLITYIIRNISMFLVVGARTWPPIMRGWGWGERRWPQPSVISPSAPPVSAGNTCRALLNYRVYTQAGRVGHKVPTLPRSAGNAAVAGLYGIMIPSLSFILRDSLNHSVTAQRSINNSVRSFDNKKLSAYFVITFCSRSMEPNYMFFMLLVLILFSQLVCDLIFKHWKPQISLTPEPTNGVITITLFTLDAASWSIILMKTWEKWTNFK